MAGETAIDDRLGGSEQVCLPSWQRKPGSILLLFLFEKIKMDSGLRRNDELVQWFL